MKKIYALLAALVLTIAAGAQTLNVKTGNVIYQFPAAQTGDMNYTDGSSLTVMGKVFSLSDIESMTIDNSEVQANAVSISYDGTAATVTVAGNVAQYVTPTISGAHVSIEQTNTGDIDGDEITYTLSGTSTDGEFSLSGSYKCTVALAGVTLTNPSGAVINIANGKRIQMSAKKNTVNTLTDGVGGSQKGCIYSKGQIQLQGNGTLSVVGRTKHAIKSGDYITVKNLTLNITAAVGDGISCNKYFVMESGVVTISGVGDEGIQCEYEDDDAKTGETADHEDENSGNVYIEGGTISVSTNGEGIESKGAMSISGGTVYVQASDDAINSAGDFTITGGYVMANSSNNDGLDANGNMYIKGGNVFAIATTQPEVGIDANTEGGKQLYITGGNIVAIGGFENGSSISGGTAMSASYNKGTWYGLYNGDTLAFAFKVPSNNRMGSSMAVYTTGTPALMSGVTGSGDSFWNGNGYTSASGGTSVTLSTYSNSGGGPGGGGPGGGGWPGGWH